MGETWKTTYDRIEDTYIPGNTLPPVKNEWRYRSERYIWRALLWTKDGKTQKKLESQYRPVFKGGVFGVYNASDEEWIFVPIDLFKTIKVKKYKIKCMYRLVSDNDDGVTVEFREEEPAEIRDIEKW